MRSRSPSRVSLQRRCEVDLNHLREIRLDSQALQMYNSSSSSLYLQGTLAGGPERVVLPELVTLSSKGKSFQYPQSVNIICREQRRMEM